MDTEPGTVDTGGSLSVRSPPKAVGPVGPIVRGLAIDEPASSLTVRRPGFPVTAHVPAVPGRNLALGPTGILEKGSGIDGTEPGPANTEGPYEETEPPNEPPAPGDARTAAPL